MTEQIPEPGTTEFSVFVCLFFNHFSFTVTLKTLIKIEAKKMNRTSFFTDVFFSVCKQNEICFLADYKYL